MTSQRIFNIDIVVKLQRILIIFRHPTSGICTDKSMIEQIIIYIKYVCFTFSAPSCNLNLYARVRPHFIKKLECGPMPNVMAALPNISGALCSMPQSSADDHYWSAMQ